MEQIKLMDNIYDQNQRIRILSHKIPERHYETNYEHLQIIDYLIQRDADKVANAMREHIINSKNSAIKIGFS
jgi:DNA-binding GntR family transcriptional regulator